MAFLLKKRHIRTRSIFWQKPWTNPFAKCRYFLTLFELHFSGLKSIVFYPEYQKMFLYGFFLLEKNTWEKGRFFDKSHELIPLQNVDFFYFARTSLFRSKKHSFLSRRSKNVSFWLSLLKRTDKEKVDFLRKTMD